MATLGLGGALAALAWFPGIVPARRIASSGGLVTTKAVAAAPASPIARGVSLMPAAVDQRREVLDQASHAFNEIARKALPAVVSITVLKRERNPLADLMPGHGSAEDGGGFTGPSRRGAGPPGLPGPGRGAGDVQALGIGSGVFIRPDGFILTNNHVVEAAEKITVTLDEKDKRSARVVGIDPKTDLAVIRLAHDPKGFNGPYPTLSFGNSDAIQVGDWAVAIGSPFGLNRTVTSGIISAKGRAQMGILDVEDFIQTDAAINPGSSGGPLLNIRGEIIGLNTAIFSEGGGNVGIGFAIPSAIAKEVADQIIAKGHVTRGWIGIAAQDLDPELARFFRVPEKRPVIAANLVGALVSEVAAGGPGSDARLEPGDVVMRFDHRPIESASQFKSLVGKSEIGRTVDLDMIHAGRYETRKLTIREAPESKEVLELVRRQKEMAGQAALPPDYGLKVEDTPGEITHLLKIPSNSGAFIVGVRPGSPAFDAGLQPGDIVLKAENTLIHGARQFRRVVRRIRSSDPTVFYVQRGPEERVFVSVKSS